MLVNTYMSLMTHDIRDLSSQILSSKRETPFLAWQHAVSRIAKGRFSHSEKYFPAKQKKCLTCTDFG